jgi:hypothetical protein
VTTRTRDRIWPADESPREHLGNAISLLMYDPSPDGITAALCRIERAMQLLDREALRRAAAGAAVLA